MSRLGLLGGRGSRCPVNLDAARRCFYDQGSHQHSYRIECWRNSPGGKGNNSKFAVRPLEKERIRYAQDDRAISRVAISRRFARPLRDFRNGSLGGSHCRSPTNGLTFLANPSAYSTWSLVLSPIQG
jgi:hypothetical protein